MIAALAAPGLQLAVFVQLTFATGTVYIWSGAGNISWNSQTWIGVGTVLDIQTIQDGASVEARGTAITLSGLDSSLLADCLSEFRAGLPANIYLGLFSSGSLIADPIGSFIGQMDQPVFDVDGQKATVQLACESRLLDMNVPASRRYTQQDQQMSWPGDLGMNFVTSVQQVTLIWGLPLNSTNI